MGKWTMNDPKGTKEKKVAECKKEQLHCKDGKGEGYSWSAAVKQSHNTM